jgi:hypothetical protein
MGAEKKCPGLEIVIASALGAIGLFTRFTMPSCLF